MGINISFSSFNYSWLILISYIFTLVFFGIRQNQIIFNQNLSHFKNLSSSNNIEKLNPAVNVDAAHTKKSYAKSGLGKLESENILSALLKVMKQKEPYLESEIDLSALAKLLDVTPHKLSQVINDNLNINFYEFINGYRLKKFKDRLPGFNDNLYNITSLAFDCGFNSKSSFYNIFKKFEKITPSQYLKQVKQKAS